MENTKFYITYSINDKKKITNTIMVFDAKQLAATLNTLNNIGYEITNIRTEKY